MVQLRYFFRVQTAANYVVEISIQIQSIGYEEIFIAVKGLLYTTV